VADLLRPFAGASASHVAGRLLDRFGSLNRALSVSDEQLLGSLGDHREVGKRIIAARCLVHASLQESVTRSRVDPDCPLLHRYLVMRFRGRPREEMVAIFADHELGFICEEVVATGGVKSVELRNRPLLRRAIELEAHGLLLVHNHPSHRPEPSQQDIDATRTIAMLAHAVDVDLIDHLIVANRKVTSMRRLGLL
jgi:DNA repair protein RadC